MSNQWRQYNYNTWEELEDDEDEDYIIWTFLQKMW